MSDSPKILSQIHDSQKQLSDALSNITPDTILISGILNYVRSRFLSLILKDINGTLKTSPSTDEHLNLAQQVIPSEETAEQLIDMIWGSFFLPVLRLHHSQLKALKSAESKHKKRTVEIRKTYESFSKITESVRSFYNDLLKHVLTRYQLGFIVPSYIYEVLSLTEDPNASKVDKNDSSAVVKLVYVTHRSILYLGSTSRYQSLLSKFLAPADQKEYTRALELCHYAELILPAFGDTRNQIAMIHDSQDDKLSALYEFLRASLSRISSKLGASNYKTLLNNISLHKERLNKARLDSKITTKNQYHLLTIYFFSLYGYYTTPETWKRSNGILINGTKVSAVEDDFLQIIENIATEGNDRFVLEKLLIILIGGIHLANTGESTQVSPLLSSLLKFTFKFINHIQSLFISLWEEKREKSEKLLAFLRIVYCWLKVSKLGLQFSHRHFEFLKGTALVSNLIYTAYPDESFVKRPTREQYFEEDVGLREFIPIDRLLSDFDDGAIFRDQDAPTRLIGKYKAHITEEETKLRAIAVGAISRKILQSNNFGILFDGTSNLFDVSNAKPPQKESKVRPTKNKVASSAVKTLPAQTPSPSSQQKKSQKNRRQRGKKNKNVSENGFKGGDTNQKENFEVVSSSSDTNSSDVVQIPKSVYESNYDPKNIKDTENIVKTTKAINAEDLEAALSQNKDNNYQSMVDSLVDDSFKTGTASISSPSNNQFVNSWQTPVQPANNSINSPLLNQNNYFAPYQNTYPYNQPSQVAAPSYQELQRLAISEQQQQLLNYGAQAYQPQAQFQQVPASAQVPVSHPLPPYGMPFTGFPSNPGYPYQIQQPVPQQNSSPLQSQQQQPQQQQQHPDTPNLNKYYQYQ